MDIASICRLIILGAIWGGSFLFMKYSVVAFGPAVLIFLRISLAAVFLWMVCLLMRKKTPILQNKRHFLILGLLNSALPFLLFAYALQTLTASLMAILNSTAPIFGAIISALYLRRAVSYQTLLGLIIGVTGVVVLVAGSMLVRSDGWWLPMLAGLGAPLCYGVASVYTKNCGVNVDAVDNAHGSMWASTLLVLPAALFFPVAHVPLALDWMAVIALAVICTGVAYLIFFKLIEDVGAVGALSVTFLVPVFGVLWAHLFLGEVVGWTKLFGGVLVLCGTALTNGVIGAKTTRS